MSSCTAMSSAVSAATSRRAVRGGSKVSGVRSVARRAVAAGAGSVRAGRLGDTPVGVVVRTPAGEVMDCFSALMRDRIIFIQDRIDENVASQVCAELLALQYEDPTADIRIFLNCTAGTQYCVTTILDMMDYISCDALRHRHGLRRGSPRHAPRRRHQGKRLSLPSTRIILSQPSAVSPARPTSAHPGQGAEPHAPQVAFFSKFTGKPFEEMGEYLVRDSYMSPQEAMEINLIDGLIGVNEAKTSR